MKPLTLISSLVVLAAPAFAQEGPRDIPWANKFFTGNPDNPPPVILQEFGVLPKGTIKAYRFKMANIYAVTMQVKEPRPECGCVSVTRYSAELKPHETGYIDIVLNTAQVDGDKSIKMLVDFRGVDAKGNPVLDAKKEQFHSKARLEIKFTSRPEIAVNPGAFQFGQVAAGRPATQTVLVTYTGLQPNWEVKEVGIRKELFDAEAKPVKVRGAKAAYQVTLTLKPDAPPGTLDEHIELKTNDPGAAVLNLAVTGHVQAPLSVVGGELRKLGGVVVNQKFDHQVILQAEKPFKITGVEGQGDGISVPLLPVEASKSQVITITFAPEKPGPVKKVLTVKTNTGKAVSLTVEGIGTEPQ